MRKTILALLVLALLAIGADFAIPQDSQYRTIVLTGTADVLIDSTLTSTYMNGKRLYINGIYWWYDNGVNTNQITVSVVRSSANLDLNTGRQFKYSEIMVTSGIKGMAIVPNITTAADSTIFFVIQGTGTDSLYMAVNYKFVN